MICMLPLLGLMVASESSCHRRQMVVPAAPQRPLPTVSIPEPPPEPAPAPPQPLPLPAQSTPDPGPPPPAPTPPPTPAPRRPRPTVGTSPAAPPTPAPTAPAPQLGPVLTSDQEKEYNSAIEQSVEHAQASLRAIGNRQLTAEQRASLEEIQNFIRQAQNTRGADLPGARRLAERAELLARNLERSVH